ncbi:rhomboid-related protein 3 isoform X1 [Pelodiscus sinensis]|uniref:rhomboid-related protein 3 isoform X1 n=1 Tax=Pelodiscus sinensis TaxID=13735 RepID=UPI00070442CC|nr:rhomboid-related protein 3 isoform X1 [Pelodiscus sinensis]|eukprot:XP_006125226.2 rhomboid-related protein 3 isoform X1 [Pelodiscus sinensis]
MKLPLLLYCVNWAASLPRCSAPAVELHLFTYIKAKTEVIRLSLTQEDSGLSWRRGYLSGEPLPVEFDPESTGYISTEKFQNLLQRHGSELDPHKLEVLLALADNNSDGKICYQDFVNLMSNKRSNSFRQAILQGNRRLCSKVLLEETGLSLSQRLIRHVAYETLPREIDRKWYYDSYTCCPPPWFMIAITIVEVAFFLYNGVVLDRFVLQVTHPLYLKNSLVYHPQLRAQAWRYLTYIFMHAGIEHLGLNVALQLLVGVPLEMVHGAARIGFVYIAGVIAGSLAVSVADMTAPVVGSSGGVYALISAHLANIVMNWSGMKCQFKLLRVAVALICMSFEFGRAVWLRFHPSAYPPCPHPSFVAHLGGVMVGITLGVVILRNYEQRLQDQSLWWIFVFIYVIFVLFAIFWNVFAYNLLDLKLPPPP